MSPARRPPAWTLVAAVAVLYAATARASLLLALEGTPASPLWPPAGLAVAAVLLGGRRMLVAVLAGAFLANVAAFVAGGADAVGATLLVSAAIAGGNSLEAWAGLALVTRFAGGRDPFRRTSTLFRFYAAAPFMALPAAAIGPAATIVGGLAPPEALGRMLLTWWMGDLAGIGLLTPFLVLAGRARSFRVRPRLALELATILVLAAAAAVTAAQLVPGGPGGAPIAWVVLPFLVWAAFRTGTLGAAAAALFVTVIGATATLAGRGPFSLPSLDATLLLLQASTLTVTITTLATAIAVEERREAHGDLRLAHDGLEARVREKTAELAAKNVELERRAEALAASNAELERFAYVASHDLQEPLRTVNSFMQLLQRRHADRLDAEAQEFILFAQHGAQRMHRLVNDLLAYSHLDRQAPHTGPVELDDVLREVLEVLGPTIEDRGARIVTGPLPCVDADRTQMGQLLQNLVSNAIKFHAPGATPDVRIEATTADGWAEVAVSDHGIGIPAAARDRVFTVFTRLHRSDEYPGSGVGLSICKKIVERHGGRIWFEPAAGGGTTFRFRLPLAARLGSPEGPAVAA